MGELSYACPISFDLTVKVASKHTLRTQDKSVFFGGGGGGSASHVI